MKKILYTFIVFSLISTLATAQEINWMSLDKALAMQQKEPKKIMMDAYTNWCGPCKMLDKNTFHNPDVVDYVNKNFYAVKFNAEGNEEITYKGTTYSNPNYDPALADRRNSPHDLARYLRVTAYPTIVFMDESGNVITPIVGYQKPTQLELYLKLFKTDDYKNITTQEQFNDYYKNFKPEFSN